MKEINIKKAKSGIYYRVHDDEIVPIDFVKYFEVVHKDEDVYEFETEDVIYPYIKYIHHACCCSYTKKETIPYNINWHFFETLDDAVAYVKDKYYADKIQEHLEAIREIEDKIKNLRNNTEKLHLM